MVTISHIVKKLIRDKPYLQQSINQGIISNSLLAKKIKNDVENELDKEVKYSAIVMALRRHQENLKKSFNESSFNYFEETLVKTEICYVVFKETSTLLPKLFTLYHVIDFKKGGILNIIQGNYEVGVVINNRYKENLFDILKMEKVLFVIDNLISISLLYSKDFTFIPGVIYNVSRILAWNDINIVSILQTPTEMSLVINKKDMAKCFEVLDQFKSDVKNNKHGK